MKKKRKRTRKNKDCRYQLERTPAIRILRVCHFNPDLVLRWNDVGCTQALVHLVLATIVEDYGERRDEMVAQRKDCL